MAAEMAATRRAATAVPAAEVLVTAKVPGAAVAAVAVAVAAASVGGEGAREAAPRMRALGLLLRLTPRVLGGAV